ncbi:glycoside hydrolase superfamily, partial [Chytriomyces sp. MP71]
LRAIVSIGGWTGSLNFSAVAASPNLSQTFAKKFACFLEHEWIGRGDIDWEYPGTGGIECLRGLLEDAANFVSLLHVLRAELGPDRHLSIAVNAYAAKYSVSAYAESVNYVGVMTYDLAGSWSAT